MFRSSWFSRTAVALFVALVSAAALPAQTLLPTPQLNGIFPAGAKIGGKAEVTVDGANLDEIEQILFSHPGITAAAKMGEQLMPDKAARPMPNQFTISVAGDVPPGVYEARVKGRFGVSNPRSFAVGTLEEVMEVAGNTESGKAQELAPGSVVNGRGDANTRDYYKLNLKANDRVLIDCRADRIDSRMDGTLAVLNAQGRELARCRDVAGKDPIIDFKAPADGVYTLVLYDFLYGGGVEYSYRLAVHKAPRVDFVFPAAGAAGSNGAFTVYGRNLPGGQPAGISLGGAALEKLTVNIPVPADLTALQQAAGSLLLLRTTFVDRFDYRLAGPGGASNPMAIGVATDPVIAEVEPNNTPDKAQKVTVPCELAAQFYPARDRDIVQFDAKKGEVYSIEVLAHRLGLECDPALTIQKIGKNDKGEETATDVATVDDPQDRQTRIGGDFDTSTDDPSYRLAVTEDATYRVIVRDNFGESRTDPRYVYRLQIRKEQPDFRLAVFLDPPSPQQNNNATPLMGPVMRKGGTLEVRVALARRDSYNGEVNVTVEGLPAGVTCPGAVLGGTVDTASLVFTAADNVAAWTGPVKIVGKATINGQEVARAARIGTCVWGTTDKNQRPAEYRIARDLLLSVMDKEMQPAHIAIGEDKVYETSRGGNIEMPVKVTRRDGFNEAIKLTKANLPNDMAVKEINIAAGANDGKLEMTLNQQNIKAGTYTFYMRGEAKYKYNRNPDAVKLVETEVAEVVEMQKQLTEMVKKANDDKNTALATELQAKVTTANARKQQLDQQLNKVKEENKPKDMQLSLVSAPVRVRIVESPVKFALPQNAVTIKAGEKAELPVTIERLYGFADAVEIAVDNPNVSGVSVAKADIAKDKADGKFTVTLDKNAAAGEHTINVRCKARLNNVQCETTLPLTLKIEKP